MIKTIDTAVATKAMIELFENHYGSSRLSFFKTILAVLEAAPAVEPAQAVDLNEIEQYRIQMAAISTTSFGYWKEHDSILPEYDTVPLRDVAKLYQKYDALYKAKPAQPGWLRAIDEALVMHDVGVANADDDYATAKDKLNKLLCVVQDIGAYFAKQESAQSAAESVSKEWDSLSSIGNRLHNISVEQHYAGNEKLSDELGEFASLLWIWDRTRKPTVPPAIVEQIKAMTVYGLQCADTYRDVVSRDDLLKILEAGNDL